VVTTARAAVYSTRLFSTLNHLESYCRRCFRREALSNGCNSRVGGLRALVTLRRIQQINTKLAEFCWSPLIQQELIRFSGLLYVCVIFGRSPTVVRPHRPASFLTLPSCQTSSRRLCESRRGTPAGAALFAAYSRGRVQDIDPDQRVSDTDVELLVIIQRAS
jgi:hypothetical protein